MYRFVVDLLVSVPDFLPEAEVPIITDCIIT